MTFPFWTVQTTRLHGPNQERRQVLGPQIYPGALGLWLQQYLEHSGDVEFKEIQVLEHAAAGIAPIVVSAESFRLLASALATSDRC